MEAILPGREQERKTVISANSADAKKINGEVLTVRSLCADDAEALSAFRNAIYSETHFMARYPEEGASLEAMRNWLAGYVESPVNFEVGAFAGEKLVGEFGVAQVRPHIKYRHRAVMGISVRKDYWGCGLGSYLMQLAIGQTRVNGFEQLELGVYSDNARAAAKAVKALGVRVDVE